MGLNVFIVQYPAKVKVSTISRLSAPGAPQSDTGWRGALYDRLEQLRNDAVGMAMDDNASESNNAGCG